MVISAWFQEECNPWKKKLRVFLSRCIQWLSLLYTWSAQNEWRQLRCLTSAGISLNRRDELASDPVWCVFRGICAKHAGSGFRLRLKGSLSENRRQTVAWSFEQIKIALEHLAPRSAEKTVCMMTAYFCLVSTGCYNLWWETGFSDLKLTGLRLAPEAGGHSQRWVISAATGLAGKSGWTDPCGRSPLVRHSNSQLLKPMGHIALTTSDAALLRASIFRCYMKGWKQMALRREVSGQPLTLLRGLGWCLCTGYMSFPLGHFLRTWVAQHGACP